MAAKPYQPTVQNWPSLLSQPDDTITAGKHKFLLSGATFQATQIGQPIYVRNFSSQSGQANLENVPTWVLGVGNFLCLNCLFIIKGVFPI